MRYRTVEVPNAWDRAYAIDESDEGYSWKLPVWWATKIGGVPFCSQENLTSAPEGYLCQLVSIQAKSETFWPWVDRENPLSVRGDDGAHDDHNKLMIGDVGELTFYLKPNGKVKVDMACG